MLTRTSHPRNTSVEGYPKTEATLFKTRESAINHLKTLASKIDWSKGLCHPNNPANQKTAEAKLLREIRDFNETEQLIVMPMPILAPLTVSGLYQFDLTELEPLG